MSDQKGSNPLSIEEKPVKLTLKQRKWIKEYLKTGNATKAAMKVYNCKNMVSAGSIGSENIQKLANPVRLLMESKGLGMGRLLEVLDDGLGANKVISAMVINEKGDGMKQGNSMTKDFIDVPDHAVRHKFMETAGKWLGVEEAKEGAGDQYNQFNFYNIPPEELKKRQKEVLDTIIDG